MERWIRIATNRGDLIATRALKSRATIAKTLWQQGLRGATILRGGVSPRSSYIWGRRYVDDFVLRDRAANAIGTLNERLYGIQDANWSVVAVINASATAQERYQYSSYGCPYFQGADMSTVRTDSVVDNGVLFTGQRFDASTALHLFRTRWFDAEFGQFLARDSLQYADGPNVYTCWFAPDRTDPTGRAAAPRVIEHSDCVVTTKEDGALAGRWENAAKESGGPILSGACNGKEIVDFVKREDCCSVAFYGHQGGAQNTGGIVTNCDGGNSKRLLPDVCLEAALAKAFSQNGCRACTLKINSCGASVGDSNFSEFEKTVESIANLTGCTVEKSTGICIIGASSDELPLKKKPCRFGRTLPPHRRADAPQRPPVPVPCG